MNIYQDAIQLLLDSPEAQRWPDLKQAFERAKKHLPVAWHFPVRACEAMGGMPQRATPAVAAITCAHMAIMLVDDMLDEDPRGAYRTMGTGKAANLAVGLNAMGIGVLLSEKNCREREQAASALNEMIQRTAAGQNMDVMNLQTEEGYWAVTRAKSSPYFEAALHIGALFGGASLQLAEQIKGFGTLYGDIMQIHDDLNDSLAVPANVDWLAGRSPLPLLFAQIVDHPQRDRFLELRSRVEDPVALEEAQEILVSCGAISYSVDVLMRRHQQATELLNTIELVNPSALTGLLDEAIAPVKHLFAKVGADLSVGA
jgi:geranylgeranyl pyrophosphate synthase